MSPPEHPLGFPLKERLREPSDEAALDRIWNGMERRAGPRRAPARRPLAMALSLVAAGALAAGLISSFQRDAGPLLLADGTPIVAVDAPAGGALLPTADGSSIRLSGGARFQPLESSGTMFLGVLQLGTASFDIHPGGPRRWQIECGLATVEVVGTQFSCALQPGHLRVAVQRGTVLVRGERVPDRVRRLTAGEALDLGASAADDADGLTPEDGSPPSAPPATAAVAAERSGGRAPPPPPAARSGESSWQELARRGRHREAFLVLGPQGLRREARRVGVPELLALADVARLSGHPAQAVTPLERILSEFAHDPQASLAAFALGRLELDGLDHPDRAAAALDQALRLGIPQALREDVRARLVEAYARVGDGGRARAAAELYLREFPDGRHRAAMESQLAPLP